MDIKMAESRDELKEKYKDLILLHSQPDEEARFRTKCLRFLENHVVADCFRLLPLTEIQKDYLKKKKDAEFQHLVKVFQLFEKYAASLLAKPWCKDLYTIKVYTGFFKYNFEQWLSLAIVYDVFKRIGYKETSPDTLTLEAYVDEDRALVMGFELYLAHTQLCVLKGCEYLSSHYSMESIVEGWFNTTGNVVNILEWLGKNKLTTKEESGFEDRTPSSTDILEETTRSESVTYESKSSYYDKNGLLLIKYPPNSNMDENRETLHMQTDSQNERRYYSANSGYTSLRAVNFTDNELYGSSGHTESTPPRPGRKSDCLDETVSTPLTFTNRLHEHLQNDYGDINQMPPQAMKKDALKSEKCVVARGGNSEHHNSHIYQNTTTPGIDIMAGKERVEQILATRRNRNSASRLLQPDCKTHTEVDGKGVKYEEDFERTRNDDKQPSQERLITRTFTDESNNLNTVDCCTDRKCCRESPAFDCLKCEEMFCQKCSHMPKKRPCVKGEHVFCQISLV